MAVPAYTEDLTDIALMESTESPVPLPINISGGGGGSPAAGADFSIQGTGAWDKAASIAERCIVVNRSPGAGVVAAGVHIFQWGLVGTPGVTANLSARGVYVIAGTSTTATVQFHVDGLDTFGAQGRVGKCYVYKYVTTANTGSIPYRTVRGAPGATPTYFGYGLTTTGAVKGSNFGMDAVRYGTGAYLTAGELISAGDASDNPCTFSGFQVQNDLIANRWGILTGLGGSNLELQGMFAIGQNNAGTATLCRFRDSNKNIAIVDTVHSETTFSQFIIDHASTRCEWTNINITALGTNNRGLIAVGTANPPFIVVGGTWTGIDTTVLRSNSELTGVTWRGAGQITENSAVLTNCIIDSSTAASAVITASTTPITSCTFISSGTGHAVECTTAGTYDWNGNVDTLYDYATVARGSNLVANSGSANATFYNNSGGAITLNVSNGATSPSIRNAASSTTTVVSAFNLTLTNIASGIMVTIVNSSTRAELFNTTSTGANIIYAHTGTGTIDILLMANNIDPDVSNQYDLPLTAANTSIKFQTLADINYDNPI